MEKKQHMKKRWHAGRQKGLLPIWIGILLLLVAGSACAGRFSISVPQLLTLLKARLIGMETGLDMQETVLFGSRLPRILAAVLIGCGLSVSGASYQGIFRNPMVSPDLLGASAGAGFGAALGFLLELPVFQVQLLAFFCGMISVALTCLISRMIGFEAGSSRLLLVLSGIVVGALFQAFISVIKYVADPFDTMPSIAFWLMGGLTYVTAADIPVLALPVLTGTVILLLFRWRINLLSFGEDEARSMGIHVKKYQQLVIFCATLMTASCVAVGGMVGWVGLIVPHFARMFAGPDYRHMLPCCAVLGSVFLLLVDDAARCLFPQELPIGILTAIIGAPVFIGLLAKGKKGFL